MDLIDDSVFMEGVYSPVCTFCRHWAVDFRKCAAFSGEIPLEIWMGENNHRQPYPGDNGIQFEPVNNAQVLNQS